MGAIVVAHWRGLHLSHVDSALFSYVVSSFGGETAWVNDDLCRCLVNEFTDLDSAIAAYPNHTVISLVPSSEAAPLYGFDHPANALYIIGADDVGFDPPPGSVELAINTPLGQTHPLWSWQVAACLMYDRFVKG